MLTKQHPHACHASFHARNACILQINAPNVNQKTLLDSMQQQIQLLNVLRNAHLVHILIKHKIFAFLVEHHATPAMKLLQSVSHAKLTSSILRRKTHAIRIVLKEQ